MRYIKLVIACVCGFSLAQVPAQAEVSDALQRLQEFRAIEQPFSLAFEQTLLAEDGTAAEVQRGRLEILPPDRFVWQYQEPFVAEFGSNGVLVWHWDPELAQVTVRDAASVVAQTPLGILLDHSTQWPAQVDEGGWLSWEPQGDSSLFTALRVQMESVTPSLIELVDALGQTTRVRLSDLTMPDAQVDPRFPRVGPETTVVDQRAGQ